MRLLLLSLLAAAALAIAACGNDSSSADSVSLAPAGSFAYGEATIRPEGDQKEQIEDLLAKFPNGDEAGARLEELFERELKEEDAPISWKDDIEPWLGEKAAGFAVGLRPSGVDEFAFMLQADDEDKARDALDKATEDEGEDASYEGVDYKRLPDEMAAGVLESWLVIGSEDGFRSSVDASKGERTLEDSKKYGDATEEMEEDRLGFVYLDSKELLEGFPGGASQLGGAAGMFARPFILTFDADEDAAEIAATVPEPLGQSFGFVVGEGSDLIEDLPAASWLAAATPDFGTQLERSLDLSAQGIGGREAIERQLRQATGLDLERDVLGWMGDIAYFAGGESVPELSGAVVIETSDETASARMISAVERLLRPETEIRLTRLSAPGGGDGFTIRARELPDPVHFFQRDGKVVLAYGDEGARGAFDPPEKLSDSDAYERATGQLGEGFTASTYVAFDPILELVDSTPLADEDDWREVKTYLEPLLALVAGAKKEGDDITSLFRISVDE